MNLFGEKDSIKTFKGPLVTGVHPIRFQGQDVEGYVYAADYTKGSIDVRLAFRKNEVVYAPLTTLFKKNTLTEDLDELVELIERIKDNHMYKLKNYFDEEFFENIEDIQTDASWALMDLGGNLKSKILVKNKKN